MTLHTPLLDGSQKAFLAGYLDNLALVERLHRLLLDVIKDEFERLGILENQLGSGAVVVQHRRKLGDGGRVENPRLLSGEQCQLQSEKTVELGFMHHQRSEIDRRSVRVRLTEKGRRVRGMISDLFARHADGLCQTRVD